MITKSISITKKKPRKKLNSSVILGNEMGYTQAMDAMTANEKLGILSDLTIIIHGDNSETMSFSGELFFKADYYGWDK